MRYSLYRTKKADGTRHPRWRIKYFNDDGSYHSQETGNVDKRLTEARAKNRLQEMERDRHNEAMGQSSAPKTAISKVIESYGKVKSASGGRRKKGWTKASKERAIKTLEWWVSTLNLKEIKDVTLQRVEEALADLKATGAADSTLDGRRNHIKALTRWATDRETLIRDPLRALRRGTIEKKDPYRPLSTPELVQVLQASRGHDYMVFKGGAVTGLRVRELTGLKVEWMDWEKGVHLPADLIGNKAKKEILVKMPKDYLAELREWCKGKAPGDFIFRPAFAMNAARSLQGYCLQLDIPVKTKKGKVVFHSLRHSFISMVNTLNPSLKTRLEVSRHEDVKTNLNYSHEEEAAQEQLIEAVSAKLHSHIAVISEGVTPENPVNIGENSDGSGTCTSFSSSRSGVSNPEHFESPQNQQLHLKGGIRVSQHGRGVESHSSHMAKVTRQLENIWTMVSDEDRQSIVNHARGLLLGLKIHRKGVA